MGRDCQRFTIVQLVPSPAYLALVVGKLEENGDVKLFTAVGRTKIAAREAAATKVLRAWGIIPEPDATMEEA